MSFGHVATSIRWACALGMLCSVFGVSGFAHAAATTFKYDELGRLSEISHDNGIVIKYTYDKAGNRAQEIVVGSTVVSPERKAVAVLIIQLLLDE